MQKEEFSSVSIGDTTRWYAQRNVIRDELTRLLFSVQRYRHIMQITHDHITHHNVMFKLLYYVESTFSKEGVDENAVITSSLQRAMNVFACDCIRLCIDHNHHMINLCVVGVCKNCIQECKLSDIDDCIAHQTTRTHVCHKDNMHITTILGDIQHKKACCIFESGHELSHTEMTAAGIFVTQLMLAISRLRDRIAIARERNIFLSGDVVVFERAVDWKMIDITSNVIDQFTVHPENILHKDYRTFIVLQDRTQMESFQQYCLSTCTPQSITYRFQYKDMVQYVYEHLQYIPEDFAFTGYMLNVTESIMTNQSLGQLRLAVESMNVGVCISNKDGIITYINTYEAEQHGYNVDQLVGKHVSLLGPERLHVPANEYIPQDFVKETINVHRNGKEYPVLLRTSCMYNDMTNEYLGKVVVSENLTMLRQRQRRLRQKNEELQSMSRTLAHDLASPANWIAETSEILLTEYANKLPEDAKELLSMLHHSANQQVKVISGARMIVKAGGKLDIRPIDSDVPIQWGIDQVNGKSKHITFHIPPCSVEILADSIQLGRVFQNLIDNSYKYRVESRPVEVTIQRKIIKNMLRFSVQDNGQGMSPDFLKQAGTLFARGIQDDSGMGVGLSFVKKIVHRHHGKFLIKSKEGVGTVVLFTIPLAPHGTE
jgi:PAS domain S-box-containing protein